MGEAADLILEGEVCQYCGDFLGGATGYPRSCNTCGGGTKHKKVNKEKKSTIGKAAVKGVRNFLKQRSDAEYLIIINRYNTEEIGIKEDSKDLEDVICNDIQSNFGKFVKWFKKNNHEKNNK